MHVTGCTILAAPSCKFLCYKEAMKILACLLTFVVSTTALIAQDARIPQDIPLQRPTKSLDNDPLLKSLRATNRQAPVTESTANAVSVEDRIAALEAKVAALESEVAAPSLCRARYLKTHGAFVRASGRCKVSNPMFSSKRWLTGG